MSEIIHFAGLPIRVGSVARQRCAWCGALIEERDASRIAVALEPGEDPEEALENILSARWDGLVAIDGVMRWAVDDPPDGKVPERACSELLPDA